MRGAALVQFRVTSITFIQNRQRASQLGLLEIAETSTGPIPS
jgi:hypothetical protein